MHHTQAQEFKPTKMVLSSQIFEMIFFIFMGSKMKKEWKTLYTNWTKNKIDFIIEEGGNKINLDVEMIWDKSFTTEKEMIHNQKQLQKFVKSEKINSFFWKKYDAYNIISRKFTTREWGKEQKKYLSMIENQIVFLRKMERDFNYVNYYKYLIKNWEDEKTALQKTESSLKKMFIPYVSEKELSKIKNKETYNSLKNIKEGIDWIIALGKKTIEEHGNYLLNPYIVNFQKTTELKDIFKILKKEEDTDLYKIVNDIYKIYFKMNNLIDESKRGKKISFEDFQLILNKKWKTLSPLLKSRKIREWFNWLENKKIELRDILKKDNFNFFYETDIFDVTTKMRDIVPLWKPWSVMVYWNRVYMYGD